MDALANQNSLAICLRRIDGSEALLQTLPDEPLGAIEAGGIAQTPGDVAEILVNLIALKRHAIASYTSLIAIAEASGFFETKSVCEAIVRQQIAMVDWLLADVTSTANASLGRMHPFANATC